MFDSNNEEMLVEFGLKVKKLRKERNLKQIELAKGLGVSQSTITDIERGRRNVTMNMLKNIASFFDISVDELLETNNFLKESQNERMIMNQCADQLKAIRESNNLSISEFANEFHISEDLYSSYENGTKQIPLNILINFAKHYNVSIDKIFGLNIEKDQSATFVTTDKIASERYEKWTKYIDFNQLTDEELDKLITYAKFLLYERENRKE